jgi:hypothetical protein
MLIEVNSGVAFERKYRAWVSPDETEARTFFDGMRIGNLDAETGWIARSKRLELGLIPGLWLITVVYEGG